jgi:hypothetical protein
MDKTGYSLEEIKAYVETHDELQRPFHHISHRKGVAGMGANFILDVAEMMKKEGIKSVSLYQHRKIFSVFLESRRIVGLLS